MREFGPRRDEPPSTCREIVLGPEHGVLHHLSYCGPDERILKKLSTWSHRNEVVDEWVQRVWCQWPQDRLMGNLHPTHPTAYGWIKHINRPAKEDQPENGCEYWAAASPAVGAELVGGFPKPLVQGLVVDVTFGSEQSISCE